MTFDRLFLLNSFQKTIRLVENTDINHYIKGVRLLETERQFEYICPGDLVLTSMSMEDSTSYLQSLLYYLLNKRGAGLVIGVNPKDKEVPAEVVELAVSMQMPLLTIPEEQLVTRAVSDIYFGLFREQEQSQQEVYFMRELLHGDEKNAILKLANFNYLSEQQHLAIFLGIDNKGYNPALIEELAKAVPINLSMQLFSICYADQDGVIVVLALSQKEPVKNIVRRILSSVQNFLNSLLGDNTVSAGVSSIFYEPERMKACILEAKQAYQILRGCDVRNTARYYDEIGIYRFFFEFDRDNELERYVFELLGDLMKYDEANHSDFLQTLSVYLEEDSNIGQTANRLFVHRNTVKYRIARTEEILQQDLTNVNVQFNLRLAFKIRKYLSGTYDM